MTRFTLDEFNQIHISTEIIYKQLDFSLKNTQINECYDLVVWAQRDLPVGPVNFLAKKLTSNPWTESEAVHFL